MVGVADGRLVVEASFEGVNGVLWSIEPGASEATLISDPALGPSGIREVYTKVFDEIIAFPGWSAAEGMELWISDGTETGTVLWKDINPGPEFSDPQNLTNVYGTLFFTADDGSNGRELFISNGTAVGTTLVKDIEPGEASSFPTELTNVSGILFFAADNAEQGIELWKSDGTTTGTTLVQDILPGMASSNPSQLTNVNGTLFFSAFD